MGDVTSNFGNLEINKKSIIRGSLIIDNDNQIPEKLRRVSIALQDSSEIYGNLLNNNPDVRVSVYISEGSKIHGRTRDIEVVSSKELLDR